MVFTEIKWTGLSNCRTTVFHIMKTIASITLTIILFIACTSKQSITPTSTDIVGKWSPTYITQTKNANGTYEPFHKINTFVALPIYEFTSDGRFLRDGKDGADCCTSGSKYMVTESKITFTERQICRGLMCISCENWVIMEIKDDTLILEECVRVRSKYVRIK